MREAERCGWGVLCAGGLAILLCTGAASAGQDLAYKEQAATDAKGNIFVSSDAGKLIWMANTEHCAEAREAEDRQTVGCLVMLDPEAGNTVPAVRLEFYLKGGQMRVIQPGGPIREWNFWESGRQAAVCFGENASEATHALYDVATMAVIAKIAESPEESRLPQWAKNALQIQDESVQGSAALREERTKWISKVLRQIGKIQPGMTRKELMNVFTAEGGLSTRLQRTYVYAECPYIKVDVRFKAANGEGDSLKEEPGDVIQSISRPYLAWGVTD